MQRALYNLEDKLFYFGTLLCPGLYGRSCLYCSGIAGRLGDMLGA